MDGEFLGYFGIIIIAFLLVALLSQLSVGIWIIMALIIGVFKIGM